MLFINKLGEASKTQKSHVRALFPIILFFKIEGIMELLLCRLPLTTTTMFNESFLNNKISIMNLKKNCVLLWLLAIDIRQRKIVCRISNFPLSLLNLSWHCHP